MIVGTLAVVLWTRVVALALLAGGCAPPTPEAPQVKPEEASNKPPSTVTANETSATPPEGPGNAGSKDPSTAEPTPAAGRVEDGFFVADGAPDPRKCITDSDCVGDTVADRTGCCQAPTQVIPHSRAYAAWVHKWRAGACADITCPPPPAPARPDDCLFDVKCVEQVCENECAAK